MSALVEGFSSFVTKFTSFCNSIVSVFSYIWSILKTLWFGLTSLLTGIWDLIVQVFRGTLFDYVGSGFSDLVFFIGVPAVVFIASILVVIIIRIGISFVFKIFRLNVDYKTMKTKWK